MQTKFNSRVGFEGVVITLVAATPPFLKLASIFKMTTPTFFSFSVIYLLHYFTELNTNQILFWNRRGYKRIEMKDIVAF